MAYCPRCNADRPITRQTFDGTCSYCGGYQVHESSCRGPVAGALDVCQFCNEPLFARASSRQAFEAARESETRERTARLSAYRDTKASASDIINTLAVLLLGLAIVVGFI